MELAIDAFEDDLTRELPSALRTFTDLEPFEPDTLEATGEVAAEDIFEVEAPSALETLELQAAALVRNPLALVCAALLFLSLAMAAGLGVLVGVTSPVPKPVVIPDARGPRVAVVTAAHEEITEPPAMAPGKLVVVEAPATMIATPLARAAPPAAPPQPQPARRSGFQRPSNLPRR